MKTYLAFYWKRMNDEKDWFEKEIEADSIQEALNKLIEKRPFLKIDSIELLTKSRFTIKKEIPFSVLENVFVTALEGGSNYWYCLSESAVKLIRDAIPKEQEPYLAVAMLKAILHHNVVVPINDAENEEDVVGYISNKTIQSRLRLLHDDDGLNWCLEAEVSGNGDAETSDVVFQFLAMGEYIYG